MNCNFNFIFFNLIVYMGQTISNYSNNINDDYEKLYSDYLKLKIKNQKMIL